MSKICEKGRKYFYTFLLKTALLYCRKGYGDMEVNGNKNVFGNRIDKDFRLLYNSIYSAI